MKLAIFASGGGSNFQAIAEAAQSGKLDAKVVLCISNNAQARVLSRAESLGIPGKVITQRDLDSPDSILEMLHDKSVTHIALAGFLTMVPEPLIEAFKHRIVNIHPALLPSFGGHGMFGLRVHQAVIDNGVQWTGVTVHMVDETYDTGPIILQHPVGVHPDDSAESLAKRVLGYEHQIYPAVLQLLSNERVRVNDGRVRISGIPPTFPLSHPTPPSH